MYDINATTVIFSFLITWTIGLSPPLLIRYAFLRRPIGLWPAIGVCTGFWFLNILIFTAMGSSNKTHGALVLVAFVSYWILRKHRTEQAPTAISDGHASAVANTGELPTNERPAQAQSDPEEPLYEKIAAEIETSAVNKALWTKAFSLANGDDRLTKAKYIQMRIIQLQESATSSNAIAPAPTHPEVTNHTDGMNLRPASGPADESTAPTTRLRPGQWASVVLILVFVVAFVAMSINWNRDSTPTKPDFSKYGTPVKPEGAFDKYVREKSEEALQKFVRDGSDAEKAARFGISLDEYQRRDARAKELCIARGFHDFSCMAEVLDGQR